MTSLYEVKPILGKGEGMIATSDIVRGTMILSEKPLFSLPMKSRDAQHANAIITDKLRNLTKGEQRGFFSLHNAFPALQPFVGIAKTNAMEMRAVAGVGGAVFLTCSRFNHSCCANACYSWDERSQSQRIFAVKNIQECEEITVNYFSDLAWANSKTERQRRLLSDFGFMCCCTVCTSDPYEVVKSDDRRRQVQQTLAQLGDGTFSVTDPGRALKCCKDILQLYKEEGETDATISIAYYYAFQVVVLHADYARASAFAKLVEMDKSDCQGADFYEIEDMRRLSHAPQTHQYAGTTNVWLSRIEDTRLPGSLGFEEWLWEKAE